MGTRPLIGITAIPRTVHAGFGTYWGQTLADNFVQAIDEAGGVSVILPSTAPEHAERQVAALDALVLSGGADTRHPVEVGAGTLLDEALGTRAVTVTTLHHQGIAELGAGLAVSARAPDGLPEAIEDRGCRILGVAWHPEFQLAEPSGQALFTWIVDEARRAA
jgi:gamma-glutamyl-gamma-aminobutyrate hydrolase PuuD